MSGESANPNDPEPAVSGDAAPAEAAGAPVPQPTGSPSEHRVARGTKRLRRKRWKRRLSALSFGVLLCLALTECSVRLVWTRIVKKWEKPLIAGSSASLGRALIEESLRGPGDSLRIAGAFDPLYRWDPLENLRHKENVTIEARPLQGTPVTFRVTTDEHGLRGPQAPAASGALKVLCLGDSMTFGQGVNDDESYPSQLQIALSKSLGRPVRVFNAGVISHGQREQISVAKRLVPILEPDLVLIQFTIANDVMDDQRWQDAPNAKGELARRPNPCGNLNHHLALTNPLARWSRAYRLGVWRWGRHVIRYRYMVEDDNIELAARQTLELREVCRDASGKAIPTGILLAPSVLQVEGGLAETLLRTIRINEGIAARMKAAEVPCLDLLGGLQAANSAGESLFIPVDRHWNAAGNRVVGVEAARFCQEQLVPK